MNTNTTKTDLKNVLFAFIGVDSRLIMILKDETGTANGRE
jgi:hypothetical protein